MLNKLISYRFVIFYCMLFFKSDAFSEKLISADNTQINYYGRFDFSTPPVAKFNWSGSTVEASFSGPVIGISLVDGQNYYDIEIDTKHYTKLKTVKSTKKYIIADNLNDGPHTIRIVQRSEFHWNAVSFEGFYIADNHTLLDAPEKPQKKIEFIGDSWTVGYGNESPGRNCSASEELQLYTNTNKSFPSLITRAYHAQSIILGWSGEGMVRNYGEGSKKSKDPFPVYYNKTLGAMDGIWDFTKWTPDLVVICLGINDFSTTPFPDESMYYNAYNNFIDTVRLNYTDVPIICVGAHTGPMNTYLKKIVQDQQTKFDRDNIYYTETPQPLSNNGCDWHPTVADDSLIATALIQSISEKIGWDNSSSKRSLSQGLEKYENEIIINRLKNEIHFNVHNLIKPAELRIVTLSGDVVMKVQLNHGKNFIWYISEVPSGIYLLASKDMGLSKVIIVRR